MSSGGGATRRERNKAKSAARLAQYEEEHPTDNIFERTDLNNLVHKPLSDARRFQLAQAKDWFTEFWHSRAQKSPDTEDDVNKFFTPQGPSIPLEYVRQYCSWLVRVRKGLISSTLSLNTLHAYTDRILSAIEYYQITHLDSDFKEQTMWWIDNDLAPKSNLSKIMKPKPIARSAEVDILLQTLYTDQSLCSYNHLRDVLYINLFLNLAVDSCGRIGEIVCAGKSKKEHCLHWGDVELWAKQTDGALKIEALVTFHWLKGRRDDPNEYKQIPLRLLPPQFVFHDTLRLLLFVALLEGHLEDVRSWEELESLKPPEYASVIRIKESSKKIPILRSITQLGQITDDPMTDQHVTTKLDRLGKLAEFTDPLTSVMMGHKPGSHSFEAYRSKAFTVDFQALARNLAPEDVTHISSMGQRRIPSAPTTISPEGYAKANQDPTFLSLRNQTAALMEQLQTQYGNLANAGRAGAKSEYDKLVQQRQRRFRVVANAILDSERQQFFAKNGYVAPQPMNTDEVTPDGSFEDSTSQTPSQYKPPETEAEAETEEEPMDKEFRQRLHDIYNSTQRYRGGSMKQVLPSHIPYSDIYHRTTDSNISTKVQATLLLQFFSIAHSLDRFQLKWMPPPGTQTCCFCHNEHADKGWRYVYECGKQLCVEKANKTVDDMFKKIEEKGCLSRKPGGYRCDFSPKDEKFRTHLYNHVIAMKKNLACTFEHSSPVKFISQEDLFSHLAAEHQYHHVTADASTLYFYCTECEDFIWLAKGTREREDHCANHLNALYSKVKMYGYNGVTANNRPLSPILNPFALHDTKRPAADRMFSYLGGTQYGPKEGIRLRTNAIVRDLALCSGKMFCPASAGSGTDYVLCSCNKQMSIPELKEHMANEHSVDCSGPKVRGGKQQAAGRTHPVEGQRTPKPAEQLVKQEENGPPAEHQLLSETVRPVKKQKTPSRPVKRPSSLGAGDPSKKAYKQLKLSWGSNGGTNMH
ncbi:hypothetical protein FQN55_001106 [Onygenales sp. PD_40]|nr:hypothetical protein FQN55_001106 [Onygenales sp. PD_40]KAK2803022.1 hypothetical protein FQN51_004049 [Onygenales sp. PD_10]